MQSGDWDGQPAGDSEGNRDGNAAFQKLFGQVYAQLRALAQKRMASERAGHTLRATELVHEVYLRLFDDDGPTDYADRAQFFHAVGEAMRRILIEHARSRGRQKRGGGRERVPFTLLDISELAEQVVQEQSCDLLALDEAFGRLEAKDARAAEVVRLRFFAGLSIDQTAEAMGLSPRTVKREWEFARAWLSRNIG